MEMMADAKTTSSETSSSETPAFWRLPPELRIYIYDDLFSSLVADFSHQGRHMERSLINATALLYASKAFFDAGDTFLKYNARLRMQMRCGTMERQVAWSKTPERIWL